MLKTFNVIIPENKLYNALHQGKPEDIAISLRQLELLQDKAIHKIGGEYICLGSLQTLDIYYDARNFTFYHYNGQHMIQVIPDLNSSDYNECLRRAYACGLLSPKFFQEFGRTYVQNLGV